MSRQHRAPMAAFIALALVCGTFFTVAAVRQGRITDLVTAQDEFTSGRPLSVADPVRLSVDLDGAVGTSGGPAAVRIVPAVATSPAGATTPSRTPSPRAPAKSRPTPTKAAPVTSAPVRSAPTNPAPAKPAPKPAGPKSSVPAAPAVTKPAPKPRGPKQKTAATSSARPVSARQFVRGHGLAKGHRHAKAVRAVGRASR